MSTRLLSLLSLLFLGPSYLVARVRFHGSCPRSLPSPSNLSRVIDERAERYVLLLERLFETGSRVFRAVSAAPDAGRSFVDVSSSVYGRREFSGRSFDVRPCAARARFVRPSCFMCDRFECLMGNVPPFGARSDAPFKRRALFYYIK